MLVYIWINLDLSPEHRHKEKHVLPGTITPAPEKSKFIKSFLSLTAISRLIAYHAVL